MIPLPSCLSLYPSAEQLHQSKATQRSLHVSANQFGGEGGIERGLAACACHQNTFAAQFKFVNLNRARAAASRECLKICYEFYTACQASNMCKRRCEAERVGTFPAA